MSSFTSPLIVEYLDGRHWRVVEPFEYYTHIWGEPEDIDIPAGFITDFASIPRVFWRILPPTGKYGKAAVVHDFLYRAHLHAREFADRIFLEAMGVLGVGWGTRHIIYLAVRLFGARAYNRDIEPI